MHQGGRQVAKAATLVMSLFIVSRTLGIVRQMVMGAMFGTSGQLDAYMTASRIPEMIFLVVAGGALGSAFIPTFSSYAAKDRMAEAWRLTSSIVNLVLITLVIISGLIWVFAPTLVRTILAPGYAPTQQAVTVRLLRVLLLSSIIFGVSGVVMAALNAEQHFLLPALAPSLYNIAIIGGAVLLGPRIGVMGLAIGAVSGSLFHLLIQIPGLRRRGAIYTPTLGLHSAAVRHIGRLMAPRVVGTAIAQLNFVINNSLASRLGVGAVSAINYAWLVMLLPQGIFAQAIGTAAFPTFADQVARDKIDEMRETLSGTLRTVFFLSLPATVGLVVLNRPLVVILFQRGAFQAASTDAVAGAVALYALGLVGHSGLEIIARAFYALHDTFTPVWVGAIAVATNIALSIVLPSIFGQAGWPSHYGLALANSAATLIEMSLLLLLIRNKMHGIGGRQIAGSFVRAGTAALAMGIPLIGWQLLWPHTDPLLLTGGGITLGAVTYLGIALLLGVEEPRRILSLLRS